MWLMKRTIYSAIPLKSVFGPLIEQRSTRTADQYLEVRRWTVSSAKKAPRF
jgi:hypothetical protein